MNKLIELIKNDRAYYTIILTIVFLIIITIQLYYLAGEESCIREPLSYGAMRYEAIYGEVAYGVLYFDNKAGMFNYLLFSDETREINYTQYIRQ